MHHKILSLILALTLVFALAACNSSAESEITTDPTKNDTQATDPTDAPTEQTKPEETDPEFEEQVLVDDENCTVKITAMDDDSIWGYAINVYLENKTDMELMFTVEDVSVNGFMCDPFWAASVAAEKKANEQIGFSKDDFEKNRIETVKEITFTLRVYDNGDWLADDIFNQTFTVKP